MLRLRKKETTILVVASGHWRSTLFKKFFSRWAIVDRVVVTSTIPKLNYKKYELCIIRPTLDSES